MYYCKTQLVCLVIVAFIAFFYFRECLHVKKNHDATLFDEILVVILFTLFFDTVSAYSVNQLDWFPPTLNAFVHTCFFIGLDTSIFLLFIYILQITGSYPQEKKKRIWINVPWGVNVLLVLMNTFNIKYVEGVHTNYSNGPSAYTCYLMVGIYLCLTVFMVIRGWKNIESHKRMNIVVFILVLFVISLYQLYDHEALLTSFGLTLIVLGIYMNTENPTLVSVKQYHKEMITGFATLVENRDDNTGGHIRRTSAYVELLAKELWKRGVYRSELTEDFINNLKLAAPMHDIGKIAVPDAILQKPGKLTDEEYEIMKSHAKIGGEIVLDTFGHLDDNFYKDMAFKVATFHHEKWNGKGYPYGIKEKQIPLAARIMAVADVFDAISQHRCYREAMPMNQCFKIIENGAGADFDPEIVKVFLEIRSQVEEVHAKIQDKNE